MSGSSRYLDEAWQWAEDDFNWQLNGGCDTVFAENHTAAQTYLALYTIDPARADLTCVVQSMDRSALWAWAEIDLGTPQSINRIQVDTFQGRAYRYLVDVKLDASDAYTLALDHSSGITGTISFAPTDARFVRVRVIGADGYNEWRVSLNEIALYGTAAPSTNLALDRPVQCSNAPEAENGCANVTDGELTTAWSAIIPDDFTIESPKWWWVDALYVAMPVYAQLSVLEGTTAFSGTRGYSATLFAKYDEAKTQRGLYSATDGLWYRDDRYFPLHSPNGEVIYWSRGNGWAFAALARVLDILPADDPHYQEYLRTFQEMATALIAVQDDAGYWHENLADANHCGGPESSGTAFFVYGLAWGINEGHLARVTFLPATVKGWEWLAMVAVQSEPDGLFGYVQGVGDAPICTEEFPLPGPTSTEDFGVGALLLAASEVVDLSTSGVFGVKQHLPLVKP
jgi:hypothetical protein